MRYLWRLAPLAFILLFIPAQPCSATAVSMQIRVKGHIAQAVTPGTHITVVVQFLPSSVHSYCLGLTSMRDRYALPVSLGRLARHPRGDGYLEAIIPSGIFPAEPAGPFLLFIGTCTSVAPDQPFVARTLLQIKPQ